LPIAAQKSSEREVDGQISRIVFSLSFLDTMTGNQKGNRSHHKLLFVALNLEARHTAK